MKRTGRPLKANEMLDLLDNQWATRSDIEKIGFIGTCQSQTIMNTIKEELAKDGYRLPSGLVPMKKVVEYFKIDIPYLKKVSKKELV